MVKGLKLACTLLRSFINIYYLNNHVSAASARQYTFVARLTLCEFSVKKLTGRQARCLQKLFYCMCQFVHFAVLRAQISVLHGISVEKHNNKYGPIDYQEDALDLLANTLEPLILIELTKIPFRRTRTTNKGLMLYINHQIKLS